ncbi:ferredoxin [Ammoniphilus sp. 3BR4]|uniref:(2Fe-2S) ferredoxin domain-containing protein n=1 Tax=Ammoniphilus sp. 3BR4 TaxID=3158265 RepID=UPI00346639F9
MTTWNLSETRHHVLICNGGSCMKNGAEEVTLAIRQEIKALGADNKIHTTRTKCNGRCEDACVVIVYPEGIWYRGITPEIGTEIVRCHLFDEGKILHPHVSYTYQDKHFSPSIQSPLGVLKMQK